MTPKAWSLLGCLIVLLLLVVCGCGGEADAGCVQSEYELERTRYRCTAAGELQTLTCGEWETLEVCEGSCSPGPEPGCR